jgi:hypothetical protein
MGVLSGLDRLTSAGARLALPRAICLLIALTCAVAAPGQETQGPDVSPLTHDEILKALVPNDASTQIDEEFGGGYRAIVDVERTDFGLARRQFLVAVVYWVETFPCNSCRHSRLGIFDLASRALIWQFDSPPAVAEVYGDVRSLKLIRITETDQVLTLAYTHFADNCLVCGSNQEIEVWLQPEVQSGHIRKLNTIWKGMTTSGNSGRRGGTPESSCGQMIKKGQRQYEYLERIFVGFPTRPSSGESPSCQELSPEAPVEFRRTEAWIAEASGAPLRRLSASPPIRIDHYAAESFPLSLPVRDLDWRRASNGPSGDRGLSPNGQWMLERKSLDPRAPFSSDRRWSRVELRRARGEDYSIRTIRLEKLDAYDLNAIAFGWSSDSSRFFVVVGGLTNWPCLLSFTVEGQDDYWEKLLTDDPKEWRDGFVLASAEASCQKLPEGDW